MLGIALLATAVGAPPANGTDTPWRPVLTDQLAANPSVAVAETLRRFPDSGPVLAVVSDWLVQDGLNGSKGFSVESLGRIVKGMGSPAAKLHDRYEQLRREGVTVADRRWTELYLDACWQRRRDRLEAHRDKLSRIVFTKHYDLGGSHYAYTEGQSDAQAERHFVPGTSLCLFRMNDLFGDVQVLIADSGGVIRDPDVSYDGRRILFAWKKSLNEDDYHLYEMDPATGSTRQLTSGLGFADYEGCYLPSGDIICNSTRCVQTVDCWWTEVSNLYTCDGDGRYLRRLTYDQVHTNFPTVTDDGRVIYTRWDYSDRGQIYPQGLFQMNPDGTGQRELYGNNSWFPTTLLHARAIPGTGKYVAIFSGHHTRQRGWLGIVDPARGRQENSGTQLIAPVRATEAVRIDRYGQAGDQFQYPYPLNEREYLVTYRPQGAKHFAVYYMTADGERELLVSDPKISCNQPIPLAPRRRPASWASAVDYRQKTATVQIQDVYAGRALPGIARGTVRSLRVVALEFRAAGVGDNRNRGPAGAALASTPVSIQGTWDVKVVLGTAEVHEDGSAHFNVPARTPIYFQALDAKGHAVQTMRSWVSAQPGERVSCVGCHDDKNGAPPPSGTTVALVAGAQDLAPRPGRPGGFGFVHEIQPILDRHCVRCHHLSGRESAKGDVSKDGETPAAFSLKGTQTLDPQSLRKWSDAYKALANRRVTNWINIQSGPDTLPPYHAGACNSRLIEVLEKGHYGVRLSAAEMERLATWIDLLVPYCGDYREGLEGKHLAKYQHFLDKRKRWETEEAKNIAALLQAGLVSE